MAYMSTTLRVSHFKCKHTKITRRCRQLRPSENAAPVKATSTQVRQLHIKESMTKIDFIALCNCYAVIQCSTVDIFGTRRRSKLHVHFHANIFYGFSINLELSDSDGSHTAKHVNLE